MNDEQNNATPEPRSLQADRDYWQARATALEVELRSLAEAKAQPAPLPTQQEIARPKLLQEAQTALTLVLLAAQAREPLPLDLGYLAGLVGAMAKTNEVNP